MDNTSSVVIPQQEGSRMTLLNQTSAVFIRSIWNTLRNPILAAIGIAQPILYLFLFGPLLSGISGLGGAKSVDSYDVFVPALLIQLSLFGGAFVGISLITEYRLGVLERLLSTPISRFALLCGRVLRDALILVVEGALLAAASLILGFRNSLIHVLICLALVALIGVAISAMSYYLALSTKSEDALSGIFNAILLPTVLLAGIMLPMTLAPRWLQIVSYFNPVTYVVDAARLTMLGKFDDWHFAAGFAVSAVLAIGCFWLALSALRARD